MASDQNNSQGQFRLARMYENGYRMGVDVGVAIGLYRAIAAQGNGDSLAALGRILSEAQGNPGEAIPIFKTAADSGDVHAMMQYARLVETSSPGEAAPYMKRAADGPNLDARVTELHIELFPGPLSRVILKDYFCSQIC
jgi:TPR repeat protein